MENVIGKCFVVENKDGILYPFIFLHQPILQVSNGIVREFVHEFDNPFSAKIFIQQRCGTEVRAVVDGQTFKKVSG